MRSYNLSVITLNDRTINYCPSTMSEPIPISYLHPEYYLPNETPNGDRNERRRQSHAEALFACVVGRAILVGLTVGCVKGMPG